MAREVSGLESARLKLIRAAEGIQVVHDKIAAYSSEHPYEIITESDGTEKLNVFREPPPEISVLGGEVIYQIRSALDHLAFDLIKMNPSGVTLPNRWFDRCEFPLWTRLPANRVPPLLKSDFASVLPGITDEPFALIESLQPYNNRDAANRWLRMLAKLSNIDKHRHLNLTVGRVWLHQEVNLSWGGANISFQTLNSGTEIERVMGPGGMSNAVKMKRPYSIFVAFDELTSVTDPGFASVANILTGCLDTVRDIVADFERFLK